MLKDDEPKNVTKNNLFSEDMNEIKIVQKREIRNTGFLDTEFIPSLNAGLIRDLSKNNLRKELQMKNQEIQRMQTLHEQFVLKKAKLRQRLINMYSYILRTPGLLFVAMPFTQRTQQKYR
jgi:hypothetical protein